MSSPTDVPWYVQEQDIGGGMTRFQVATEPPDGERYGWCVCTVHDFPEEEARRLAHLLRAAPKMQEALAEMLGAAEVDALDSESNVWRSAMIAAREALEASEPQQEVTP